MQNKPHAETCTRGKTHELSKKSKQGPNQCPNLVPGNIQQLGPINLLNTTFSIAIQTGHKRKTRYIVDQHLYKVRFTIAILKSSIFTTFHTIAEQYNN